jgi:hypothetical protein
MPEVRQRQWVQVNGAFFHRCRSALRSAPAKRAGAKRREKARLSAPDSNYETIRQGKGIFCAPLVRIIYNLAIVSAVTMLKQLHCFAREERMPFWSKWFQKPITAAQTPRPRPTFTDLDREYIRTALDRLNANGLRIWPTLNRDLIVTRALVDAELWGFKGRSLLESRDLIGSLF